MTEHRQTVAIVGDGEGGAEFLRLALGHPHLRVTQVASEARAGEPVCDIYPTLRGRTALTFTRPDELADADILVLALPPGDAARHLTAWAGLAGTVVDLSPDFRLRDPDTYRAAYGAPHPAPEELSGWVYGVPEIHREALRGAARIAAPGDLATGVILTLYPLLRLGVLLPRDIVVSGLLGRGPDSAAHPARPLVGHPHTAEAAQALPGHFPLHLTAADLPRARGLLLTAHAWVPDGYGERDVWSAYREVYAGEPFVRLLKGAGGAHADPARLDGTNFCDIGFEMDNDTGRAVLISALDHRMKGGAGQALQSLNVARGWPETAGLEFTGLGLG